MSKLHLYLLAGSLAILGLALFVYKAYVLGFPLSPKAEVQVWNVEAQVRFIADGNPVKVSMFIPGSTSRFAVVDEHFISGGYGFVASLEGPNRQAVWSIRKAEGKQSLYYKAVIMGVRTRAPQPEEEKPGPTSPGFQGPSEKAAQALIGAVKAQSADTPSMVTKLIQTLSYPDRDENVKLLLGPTPDADKKARLAVRILQYAGIPARVVQGIRLEDTKFEFSKKVPFLHWLEVYHNKNWLSFDPLRGKSPVPRDWFAWWKGPKKMVTVEGGREQHMVVSVSPRVEKSVSVAVRRGEVTRPLLLKFSLFSLPVNTQAVYRVLLLVPVGALLLTILRNVVGIKTFGTFMPVLIGLSFRETGLLGGVLLFSLLVTCGLAARFYLERLKLLVVPRLAAVLIIVVMLMAVCSIVTHALGFQIGLSVALFPMVILTMTIERMSIVWEERGAREALVSGLGSLITAALAFLVMNIKYIEHLVFVFPELLLPLLAATLLLGRYSGYRLMDLYRFRALAQG